jgi:type IV pilus assembly protein PilA
VSRAEARFKGWPGSVVGTRAGRGIPAMKIKSDGFTLLELLVVVAILGILSAIAIPLFVTYRQRGYDARAISDLRNAANAEEAYFTDTGRYATCNDAACQSTLPDFRLSPLVTIAMQADSSGRASFTGTATATGGSKTFSWDSQSGGLVN